MSEQVLAAITIALNILSAIVAVILLYSTMHFVRPDEPQYKIFALMIALNIISLLTSSGNYIPFIRNNPVLKTIDNSLLIVSFYFIEILFSVFIILSLKKESKVDRILNYSIHIIIMTTIIIWLLPEFGIVEVSGHDLFQLGQIPGWLGAILIAVLILKNAAQLGRRQTVLFMVYLTLPLLGMSIRNLNLFYSAQHVATTLSLLLIHVVINLERSVQLKEQERRNEENKTQIMLTQIKPHFIYNSLNTIYYLCETNPPSAQKAISEFSDYLRGNLDSLTTQALIPFKKELEHIHHYLYLEKLRFDEDLQICYDTPVIDFNVPALSIQLLVENAVKHGIGRKAGGGTVTIRSRETNSSYVITVSDDGVGFNPETIGSMNDNRSHIGVRSMRSRVESIGGTVDIQSRDQSGTTVTVTIPKDAQ